MSGPVSVIPGGAARLKGYRGPGDNSRVNAALTVEAAEAAAGTVGRSVSLPANLAARARFELEEHDPEREDAQFPPTLLWPLIGAKSGDRVSAGEAGGVTEFGALRATKEPTRRSRTPLSVDQFLAAQMPPLNSPPLPVQSPGLSDAAAPQPAPTQEPRSKPGLQPIEIPIRESSSLSLPYRPTSKARLSRARTPDQPARSPGTSSAANMSPRPRLMPPRISSDFVRQSDEPSLTTLRARQAAETEAFARNLAALGDPSHRNSRILPGATLPGDWASQTLLVRSKTMGAIPDRWRDPYDVPPADAAEQAVRNGQGGSPHSSSSLRRSLSDSPLLPTSVPHGENERGVSLGRVAGRRQSSIGKAHGRTVSVPTTRTEQAGHHSPQHPSSRSSSHRPFPSEFEEVPFRRGHFRPASMPTAATAAQDLPLSPSTPGTPHMPQIVENSPPPTTFSGASPDLNSSAADQAADQTVTSPILRMIKQLEAPPSTGQREWNRSGAPGAAPVSRGAGKGPQTLAHECAEDSDAMERLGGRHDPDHDHNDLSPYEYRRDARNASTQSEAGYPFPLAGYLDSAAPSRSASTDAGRTAAFPGPPAYLSSLQSRSSLAAPPRGRISAPNSPESASGDDRIRSGPFVGLGVSSRGMYMHALESPDRSVTMEQMEREIAQMEAELAASGTPRSMYDSPYLSSIRSPPAAAAEDEPASPSPSGVTPRSAKRWSLVEMERAYERMKSLLAASSNERHRSQSLGLDRPFALDSVPEGVSVRDNSPSASPARRPEGAEQATLAEASTSPQPSP